MKKVLLFFLTALLISANTGLAAASDNKAKYIPRKKDKVLEEIIKLQKESLAKKDQITQAIKKRQQEEQKAKKRLTLKADLTGVYPPKSLNSFSPHFHFPPVAQYMTSTCWSFAATSYFESEIYRLTKKKLKLSEMWAPYFELLEKCRRFIQERGKSYVAGGAEFNSVSRMWKKHGIVPASVYPGTREKGGRHNHNLLMKELKNYLTFVKDNEIWDEQDNLQHIRMILNKHLGEPPASFEYQGRMMTPLQFLKNETGLNLDDYHPCMSTSKFPFYTCQEFEVPDNWWHSKKYINLPLTVWYRILKKAVNSGYTIAIGGDVSEPGILAEQDLAFIPTFDIPARYINQDSREYRIYNRTSSDDHGIHLVGYKRYKGHDWFLIKDSGRSSRKGKHPGYYFYRGDFVRLKMLSYTIHKDLIKDILEKVK